MLDPNKLNAEETNLLKEIRIRQLKDYSSKKQSFVKLGIALVIFSFMAGTFLNIDEVNLFAKMLGLQAMGYPVFPKDAHIVGTVFFGIEMALFVLVTFIIMVRFFFLGASPKEKDALKEMENHMRLREIFRNSQSK